MNFVSQNVENAAIGIAVSSEIEKLDLFKKPGVAAAIWRRELPHDFKSWIDALPVENLPSARIVVKKVVIRDAVEAIFQVAKIRHTLEKRFFVDDVVSVAERFASMMQTQYLRLRFDVVQDNACRKFHIDAVTARLVCTYRGIGTQYGISTDGEEPKRVFTTPTGSPIILRGTKWPEPPPSGLLHRSPPIEGTGETRLVFVVDPVEN